MNVYEPHPRQMFYSVLLMITGYVLIIREGWIAFGILLIVLGVVGWGVLHARILLDGYKEYWLELSAFIATIERIKDQSIRYHVWTFFGFNAPIREVKVIEHDVSRGEAYPAIKYHDLPIPVHVMQYLADNLLTGKPFSENELAGKNKTISVLKFRKYQKIFREKELAKPNNKKSNNMGFSLTRKGQKVLYAFASESVKQQLKEKGVRLDET